jgi:hypothetical protein
MSFPWNSICSPSNLQAEALARISRPVASSPSVRSIIPAMSDLKNDQVGASMKQLKISRFSRQKTPIYLLMLNCLFVDPHIISIGPIIFLSA